MGGGAPVWYFGLGVIVDAFSVYGHLCCPQMSIVISTFIEISANLA